MIGGFEGSEAGEARGVIAKLLVLLAHSTSPAISSVGTRGFGEVADILIEVYAVEGHLGAVIQSGPAGRQATRRRSRLEPYRRILPWINPLRGPCWREIVEPLPIGMAGWHLAARCFSSGSRLYHPPVMVYVHSGADGRHSHWAHRETLLAQSKGRVALLQEGGGPWIHVTVPTPRNYLCPWPANRPARG
jgi:hypothetical protein